MRCYTLVVAEARRGARPFVGRLDVGVAARLDKQLAQSAERPRSASAPFFKWLTAQLPAMLDRDVDDTERILDRLSLPYAASTTADDESRALLLTILDDARIPVARRKLVPRFLLERGDDACCAAIASRAVHDVVTPRHVVAAVMHGAKHEQVYEELSPRLRDPVWRPLVIERLGRGADPRFLDDAVRLLGEDPHLAVVLLEKLAVKRGPTGERAREELRSFIEATTRSAAMADVDQHDRDRRRAAVRALAFLKARTSTDASD